jgi:2-desacetyl-2-hydroxyethyl bacteriochlorophyllide A dehydrogenase
MKVLVYQGPRRMILEEQAEPKPAPGEALIKVAAVGICGSELEGFLGLSSLRKPPLVMGHEFSGEIVELNSVGNPAVRVGQRVTVNPIIPCGICPTCQAELFQVCPQRSLVGAQRPGAFAGYVAVPVSALLPLPDTLDPQLAAVAEPFATALHGVGLAGVTGEHGVVVWGTGIIGLLTICGAKLAGASRIIAIDTNPARLESARLFGATITIDASRSDAVTETHQSLEGLGRVAAFDAAGRKATRQGAAAVAGPGGRVILLGLHERETSFDVNALIRAEIALQGSYAYSMADMRKAVELLAAGALPAGEWLDVRELEQGPASFLELVDRPGITAKVVLLPNS